MTIHGVKPAITNLIDRSFQFDNSETQQLYLNLAPDKDYIITIIGGQVFANRDLGHSLTIGRTKNAVIDFFSRVVNKNERAFTTRASQIQSQVQQYITEKKEEIAVNKLLKGLLNLSGNGFENVARFLKSETKFPEVTLKDVKEANEKRLGLEILNSKDKETVIQNFRSFIIGKDAIFDRLTTGYQQELESFSTPSTPKQQIELTKIFDNRSKKANAEFNTQFINHYKCFIPESTDL